MGKDALLCCQRNLINLNNQIKRQNIIWLYTYKWILFTLQSLFVPILLCYWNANILDTTAAYNASVWWEINKNMSLTNARNNDNQPDFFCRLDDLKTFIDLITCLYFDLSKDSECDIEVSPENFFLRVTGKGRSCQVLAIFHFCYCFAHL